ncbi:hypothetical protein BB561_006881 [Smittium simulii]|uniref:Retrotransposon gag domain-containing protein n=1 Tax=Smittium simulii TaxID=133385 RepID=A0A2T9Y0I6_9FUNG|nr:hypothetical protein BB561_006881 [Smittium simulii]
MTLFEELPPHFTGEESDVYNSEVWIAKFNIVAYLNNWDETTKLNNFKLRLQGKAAEWLLEHESTVEPSHSILEWQTDFLLKFKAKDCEHMYNLIALTKLKENSEETNSQFNSRYIKYLETVIEVVHSPIWVKGSYLALVSNVDRDRYMKMMKEHVILNNTRKLTESEKLIRCIEHNYTQNMTEEERLIKHEELNHARAKAAAEFLIEIEELNNSRKSTETEELIEIREVNNSQNTAEAEMLIGIEMINYTFSQFYIEAHGKPCLYLIPDYKRHKTPEFDIEYKDGKEYLKYNDEYLQIKDLIITFTIEYNDRCAYLHRKPTYKLSGKSPISGLFDNCQIDFLDPSPVSKKGNRYIINAIKILNSNPYSTCVPGITVVIDIGFVSNLIALSANPRQFSHDCGPCLRHIHSENTAKKEHYNKAKSGLPTRMEVKNRTIHLNDQVLNHQKQLRKLG